MSPPRDIDPASPTSRDVWLSLTFERSPAADLMARLTVDEPEGRLVDVELDGNELARLLAGETVTVAATIGAERGEALPATPDVVEAEAIPEDAGEPAIEVPASVASSDYGTSVDDPPAGTEPIARSTDVAPGEAGRGVHPRAMAGRGRGPAGHRQSARDLLTASGLVR